jgi:PAS domain S-box-containing protein
MATPTRRYSSALGPEGGLLGKVQPERKISNMQAPQPFKNPNFSTYPLSWVKRFSRRLASYVFVPGRIASAEAKFGASLAAIGDAVFICDTTGVLTDFNDAFVRFHRFGSSEECRKTLNEYPDLLDVCTLDGKVLPVDAWPVPRALRGESATNVEHLLIRKDLNERWLASYSFAPIRLDNGTIIGSVATARDVTQSKRAEEDLRNVSSRLHLALTSAHLGVWDWDIKHQKLHWDERMFELYGTPRSDFTERVEDWQNPLHPDDRERAIAEIDAALRGERDFDTEFRVIHRDGTIVHLKANGIVLRAPDGIAERMLGVNADITIQKGAETELKRAYAEVEAKVEQRTAALEAAKIAAENASRAKDLFLATLSHELRSPLAAILSWSQLMERGGLSPEKMQLGIRTIKENVWSQNQLISDLLDISRITTGKLMLDVQTINVHEVLVAAIDTIRLSAEQRGISIVEHLNGTNIYISADPARLKQALWNLLSNAIKFTPRGGSIFVTVTCPVEPLDQHVRIEIRDTGRGIKPEFLPNLFETFSQADPSSVRIHGGMGLGLSLVKSLVELQRGNVTGESPGEGKGATFTIAFPLLHHDERIPTILHSASLSSASVPSEELQDVKVLLVEDGNKTREALHHLLETHGARVCSTASAQEAMAAFDSDPPDIIVSDIAMPYEDGHSLLRKLRTTKGDSGAKIPAIALTAFAEPKDRAEAFASGFQEYLTKPVDETVLTSTIARLVSRKAAPSLEYPTSP